MQGDLNHSSQIWMQLELKQLDQQPSNAAGLGDRSKEKKTPINMLLMGLLLEAWGGRVEGGTDGDRDQAGQPFLLVK